ncbi:MAG: hypothetical protein O2780_15360 [Proteobacteria bacterium]|nr:hypothetical protein [Pseudomonadota bacterium]MDA1299666.1 hypothetical protein [Pseudomonadota bacterium]
MEVLATRCAVRKTSRHDNGVPDPGTLRAPGSLDYRLARPWQISSENGYWHINQMGL